ncbi:MAG TPA: hypothetical protein DCG75_04520 [Bacteroidales bacterium]|nr:hypothetical protein [Bacteroidales bacterium]
MWSKEELQVYISYCKLNNLKYECVWINMNDDERLNLLGKLHQKMLQIDKSVKVYLDFEYVDSLRYSLIDFVKDEMPNKLLTWIPDNFSTKQEMVKYVDNYVKKELYWN